MTTPIKLTDTQRLVLQNAIHHNDGRIVWFPDSVKGAARQKVLDGLTKHALIAGNGTDWVVTPEGYDALGRAHPALTPIPDDPELEASVAAAEATWAQASNEVGKGRIREHSKQAAVIQMLRRPEGATIQQICDATGWQPHTVRGTFAGAFKKKLGLHLTSEKDSEVAGGERIYRIIEAAANGTGL